MSAQAGTWHIGLTRLVPPVPAGRLITGLALFFAMVTGYAQSGLLTPDEPADNPQYAAIFFSAVIGYIIPMFHLISARTVAALDLLAADAAHDAGLTSLIHRARERVYRKPRTWMLAVISVGLLAGFAHNIALSLSGQLSNLKTVPELSIQVGTMLVWVILPLAGIGLVDNALRLAEIGRRLPLRPFEQSNLEPIARVAVYSTLALVGTQTLYPILMMGREASAVSLLPGMVATLIPMLMLALVPIRPLYRRLRDAKRALLLAIDREISRCGTPAPDATTRLDHLTRLLDYRREARAIREWPIDLPNTVRFLLYVIIPPFTWIAAALLGRVVDALL
ncbi:MAG: hypothetical protein ACO3P1_03885 [Pseudomonadales bacterium]